jgi:hypothetical protein
VLFTVGADLLTLGPGPQLCQGLAINTKFGVLDDVQFSMRASRMYQNIMWLFGVIPDPCALVK